jgi:ribosomal protein S18 acetylase RimI-like enzyme
MNHFIREASPSDEAFLREMLYHSLYVPDGGAPFDRGIVSRPEIAKYVERWGRTGDLGFIAVHSRRNEPLGAAWLRLFTGSEKGYGYVGGNTPELGIAVLPEYRGRGLGSALLRRLLEAAAGMYDSVSLSVAADSPARRLYERIGFEQVSTSGTSVTMVKRLRS